MSQHPFISELASKEHQRQAEEFIFELGAFVIAFERMCEAMRAVVTEVLRSEGLKHEGLTHLAIGDKTSVELQVLVGSAIAELRSRVDESDKKAVANVLKEIKELTETRNVLVHSSWRFGAKEAAGDLFASTLRPRTKQSKGAVIEVHGFSAKAIRHLTQRCTTQKAKLQRLQYCVSQRSLKIASELAAAE